MSDLTPAAEPAPVPPPVDARLTSIKELIADYGFNMRTAGRLQEQGATAEVPALGRAARDRDLAWIEIDALWAAGVEEGRRLRDVEIHAEVHRSAVAAYAAFGPTPESVTVSYTSGPTAYEQGIYDAGIAEGRRQATEERTEEQDAIALAGEVVHRCPPAGEAVMPCCGRTPFEVSRWSRMTVDPTLVTCGVEEQGS